MLNFIFFDFSFAGQFFFCFALVLTIIVIVNIREFNDAFIIFGIPLMIAVNVAIFIISADDANKHILENKVIEQLEDRYKIEVNEMYYFDLSDGGHGIIYYFPLDLKTNKPIDNKKCSSKFYRADSDSFIVRDSTVCKITVSATAEEIPRN